MSEQPSIMLHDPVVVAVSNPDENRWGYHQFPRISRLPGRPGGRLLLTYNFSGDDNLEYGEPGPAYTSRDTGGTWQSFDASATAFPAPELTVSHSPVSELYDDDYLCVPMQTAYPSDRFPRELIDKPVARFFCYNWRSLYDLQACPFWIRNHFSRIDGVRWDNATQHWKPAAVRWDTDGLLVRMAEGNSWSRTSFEHRLVKHRGLLFYADWKSHYLHADGRPPLNMETVIMVSDDNAWSFKRRTELADPTGEDMLGESALAETSDNALLCVMRRADHNQKPMMLSRSADAGHTWTPLRSLHRFGVLPQLRLLGNGVMVLSFGRPGVWLSLSADGTGRDWTEPVPVTKADDRNVSAHTCGYTDMVALDDNNLLLAYSDFRHQHDNGTTRKAIMVRRVTIT